MKPHRLLFVVLVVLTFSFLGCGKSSQTVDPAPLESNFSSADASAKGSADKAVAAIKAGDYAGAMAELKTLGSNAKLTPAQKQAVSDVIAQIQQALASSAAKAQGDATKAASDLQKSLPK